MKTMLVWLLASTLAGWASCGSIEAKMGNFPNQLQFSSMNSDEVRICMCGFHLIELKDYGKMIEMYKLAQVGWEIQKLKYAWNFSGLKENPLNAGFINRTGWYGLPDPTWVTMKMPAALMQYVLKGYTTMMNGRGFEIDPSGVECKPAVSYMGDDMGLATMSLKGFTEEQKSEFVGKFDMGEFHGGRNRWYFGGAGDAKKAGLPDVAGVGIACNVTGKIKENEDDEGRDFKSAFAFKGDLGVHSFGYTSKHIKFDDNPYKMIKNIESSGVAWRPYSKVSTTEGFIFQEDLDSLDGTGNISEFFHVPNMFQYTFCQAILNELAGGLHLTDDNFPDIFNYYSKSCPILAHNQPFHIPSKGVTLTPMYRFNGFDTEELDTPISSKLTGYKVDKYKINIYKMPDDLDVFTPDDGYLGIVEEKVGELVAQQDKMKEDLIAQEALDSTDTIIEATSVMRQEILDEKRDNLMDVLENESTHHSGTGSNKSGGDETESIIGNMQEISIKDDFEMPMDLEQTVEEKNCLEGILRLEKFVQDLVPKSRDMVFNLVQQMMMYPHKRECRELIDLIFSPGKVISKEPYGPVLEYTVKKLTPAQLTEQKQDPESSVYEVHFFNHSFDDQKDSLYYITGVEFVNEWDKYTEILFDFYEFAKVNLGSVLTPHQLTMNFLSKGHSYISGMHQGWNLNLGPTGSTDTQNNSSPDLFTKVMSSNALDYVFYILRLYDNNGDIPEDFYDIIYQCWRMGESYLMIKMMGTRLTYQIMVNIYATDEKIQHVVQSMAKALMDTYINGDKSVVSLKQAKKMVYTSLVKTAAGKPFEWALTENTIPLPGLDEFEGKQGHENMYKNDHPEFMYNMLVNLFDKAFVVRGFIHTKENLPVMNLFFSNDMFQSEYIVPLVSKGEFRDYVDNIVRECYYHLHLLVKEVSLVENQKTPEAELLKAQELGRYTLNSLVMKVLDLLKDKDVYGCIQTNYNAESEKGEDGEVDDSVGKQKRYKWTKPVPFDPSGEFTMLRSNKLFTGDLSSKCDDDEAMNPLLINLHSTFLDKKNGYALTINNLDNSGKKDVKTTYHFVQYQDYAHMRVFEHYIKGIINTLFFDKGGDKSGKTGSQGNE